MPGRGWKWVDTEMEWMKSLYRRLPADCWWISNWAMVLNEGEDEEEFSPAPKREFSKNVELSGTVRMNAAGSSTVVLSCLLGDPSSSPSSTLHHNITSTFTKWEEGGRRWKKRRKNAQQSEEKKEEMRRGLLNSRWSLLLGRWRVFCSPSGSNSVYFMII